MLQWSLVTWFCVSVVDADFCLSSWSRTNRLLDGADESHSVLHGRPFPLKGRFLANIFVHFEPVGHSLRHDAEQQGRGLTAAHAKYRDSLARGHGGHENEMSDGLPPYVVPGTPEETNWRKNHPEGFKSKRNSATTGSQQTVAHFAAQAGDLEQLQLHVKNNRSLVNAKDANGWTPLHGMCFLNHTKFLALSPRVNLTNFLSFRRGHARRLS